MRLPDGWGHLTYCTNVHRGESWAEVRRFLEADVLAVRNTAAPDQPFGVGLRLSAAAVEAANTPEALAELKSFLADNDLYVFTLNAFPYGPFHGVPVKAGVYRPDWLEEERLTYTNAAATLLAAILPGDLAYGSISTVPGAFKARSGAPDAAALMADRMLRQVVHLVEIERQTGRRIQLALEPEPCCFLETTDEAIAFFETHLFADAAADRLGRLTGLSRRQAADAVRRHMGLCIDLCHAAIEFETPDHLFVLLRDAGVEVAKVQISAGLRIDGAGLRDELRQFDDGIYLHQVVDRHTDGTLRRHADLCDAFAAWDAVRGDVTERRVHFHVPLFLDDLGPFGSTQDFVRSALALHRRAPLSAHLEVETYTWDVLPARYRTATLADAIARELLWVRRQLGA